MSTPSTQLVWAPAEVRAFAHEVATAASELRELAPLLRALGDLRVAHGAAPALRADLDTLTQTATRVQAMLADDAQALWAAAGASATMEAGVTAILTQRPPSHPHA